MGVTLRKIGYGAAFVVGVPALMIWWAGATDSIVTLPPLPYPWAGWPAAGLGLALMLAGMYALARHGRGLPMNAFPPRHFVTQGAYGWLRHPIYVGFGLVALGVAVGTASPAGTWLVTPVTLLALAALVMGYERHDLRRRFGDASRYRPRLALPPGDDARPGAWDRVSVYALVLVPWSAAFEAVYRLGLPRDAVSAYLPFETGWPVLQWSEAVYGSAYLLVLAAPLVVPTRRALRHLALTGLVATAAVTLVYLVVPLVAPPRPFVAQGVLGRMLRFEQAMSHTVAAFPSFHVIWSLIAAEAWAGRGRWWGAVGWSWAGLIVVSCSTTGMHAVVDLIAAVAAYLLVRRYREIWAFLRRGAERVANSWREWRWGPVRLINHGFYAAAGGAVAFTIAGTLGGPEVYGPLLVVHVGGLLGAGLWAQQLEGSPKLSRPYGYYGSVIGAVIAALAVGGLTGTTMRLFGLVAMEAPWLQAIGRLRCLVQGCCHGSPAPDGIGIRYTRDHSRVCALGNLKGVPVHPTPLYSILGNLVIGVLLARLWSLGAPLSLIAGAYLMLSGLARFVEESYRGEPQTPIVGGLRLYQWLAILSFGAGIGLTTLPSG
ncbi:MAG TPA: prolipoprotein diacylglyceryl transferase family protein, partial [Gemmatimonadales bacterium]|nr:prolipoprotein diacylglyceryl transferase family protein [Gemmatimonadales bacterium]